MELLYKYRSCDTRSLDVLRKGKVWMALPSSFNDPFDCVPKFSRNAETEERDLSQIVANYGRPVIEALKTGAILADRTLQPIQHRRLVNLKKMLKSKRSIREKYQVLASVFLVPPDCEAVVRVLQSKLDQIGVFSLSTNPSEMAMWAHYASQHSGFCLGFERTEGSVLKDSLFTKKVTYSSEYPKLTLDSIGIEWSISIGSDKTADSTEVKLDEPNLHAVLYTKSNTWKYEQEWRVVQRTGGVLSDYPGPLRRVIYGLRCNADSRRQIQEAVMAGSPTELVQFSEIRSELGSFELTIHDLPTAVNMVRAEAVRQPS